MCNLYMVISDVLEIQLCGYCQYRGPVMQYIGLYIGLRGCMFYESIWYFTVEKGKTSASFAFRVIYIQPCLIPQLQSDSEITT